MTTYVEPKLIGNAAVIGDIVIKDSEIFQNVGYKNYIHLHRKYPNYFKFFTECNNITSEFGYLPSDISLRVSDDPEILKKDIVKTIYYNKWFSNNSNLVFECKDKISCKPTEFEDSTSIWVFICIIIISLIVFAIYILSNSSHIDKLFDISNISSFHPYVKNLNI